MVWVAWPRYPALTSTGKVSAAKVAGRPAPWLSLNVVNRLHRRAFGDAKALWEGEARRAALSLGHGAEASLAALFRMPEYPWVVFATLYKRGPLAMDTFAVLEGVKPSVDGIVRAGTILPDDGPRYLVGGVARSAPVQESTLGPGLLLRFEHYG